MTKYKLVNYNGQAIGIQKYVNDAFELGIPFDPDNTDYQAYLRWLEAGNTPTPAEENQ